MEITNAQRMKEAEIVEKYNEGSSIEEIAREMKETVSWINYVIGKREAKIYDKMDEEFVWEGERCSEDEKFAYQPRPEEVDRDDFRPDPTGLN